LAGVSLAQPVQQFGINALRQDNGQARVDAQSAQMRNFRQGSGQLGQFRGCQRQRIAAGKDDFIDVCRLAQVVDGFPPLAARGRLLGVREVPPEAIATVDGTGSGCDQQGTPGVLVQQARAHAGIHVAHRVRTVVRGFQQFGGRRQHLHQQGIARVAPLHPGNESARHAQAKSRIAVGQQGVGLSFKPEQAQQLAWIGDRVAPDRLPGPARTR
jgi:hypothetical protein